MMLMLRRKHRRLVEELQRILGDYRTKWEAVARHNIQLQVRLELVTQARDKADADASYWRARAERFLDQIALKHGIIASPTMTEPELSVESRTETIFSALGTTEINTREPQFAPRAAPPAAPLVTAVDSIAAQAAVEAALAGIGRTAS